MGFLDRLQQQLADTRRELEASKLAAGLRKERGSMQRLGGRTERTPEEERRAAMAAAVAGGAVDPTTLLSHDEVEVLVGDRIGEPSVHFAEVYVSVSYDGDIARYRLASIHAPPGGAWDVAAMWKRAVAGYDELTPVDGLGDVAFRSGSYTLVRAGGRIVFVEITAPGLAPDDAAAVADALMRGAVARIGSSPGPRR